MKLLMISGDRSILAGKKGAFYYTLEELRTHWDRIDIICPKATVDSKNVVPFDNVFFHPSPWKLASQSGWILKRGQELIAEHHHDVMTVHEYPPFYNGLGASRLKKTTGIPAVSEIHHLVGYPRPASVTELIGRWMTRLFLPGLLKKFDGVRVVNQRVFSQLERWGVSVQKIQVIESFYLDQALIDSLSPQSQIYDVVFCGRMVENKGISKILEAMRGIDSAKLLLIGDGPLRMKLERQARDRKIADRVTFMGWLPTQRDVLQAIRSAKMLVMNSTSEGGPRVVLEAMACGVPVIATRVGVMEEVITHGLSGLLTTGGPDDLAGHIEHLLHNDDIRRKIADAGKQSVSRFERKKLIADYAHFLQSFA